MVTFSTLFDDAGIAINGIKLLHNYFWFNDRLLNAQSSLLSRCRPLLVR